LENRKWEEKTPSRKKRDAAKTTFEEKERGCTVRLFGTNSLKKGAV
jgi:hypothetical protein